MEAFELKQSSSENETLEQPKLKEQIYAENEAPSESRNLNIVDRIIT